MTALTTFSDLIQEVHQCILRNAKPSATSDDHQSAADGGTGPTAYADAVCTYLAFALSKVADLTSTLVTWRSDCESSYHTFGKQALPMAWDFAELNPLLDGTGTIIGASLWTAESVEGNFCISPYCGQVTQIDATESLIRVHEPLICTDPPYYDNIGYADLSDFFYVWLRRSLVQRYPSLFATVLTPKTQELIASPYRHEGNKEKARTFFEDGFGNAFSRMRHEQL